MPTDSDTHRELGHALERCGRLDEAIESHQKAVALDPTCENAQRDLGNALQEAGRFDEAANHHSKMVELGSQDESEDGYVLRGPHTRKGKTIR